MKVDALRKNSLATIERLQDPNRGPAKSWDEAAGNVAQKESAIRCLELCDIFDSITEDERSRLAAIPAYKTDLREVADIRSKYGVSWNELRMLRGMAWGAGEQWARN